MLNQPFIIILLTSVLKSKATVKRRDNYEKIVKIMTRRRMRSQNKAVHVALTSFRRRADVIRFLFSLEAFGRMVKCARTTVRGLKLKATRAADLKRSLLAFD